MARAAFLMLCLLPVLVLAAWFIGLAVLVKMRSVAAPEQAKPAAVPAPLNVDEILKGRQAPNGQ